jgi:hypothetical protein
MESTTNPSLSSQQIYDSKELLEGATIVTQAMSFPSSQGITTLSSTNNREISPTLFEESPSIEEEEETIQPRAAESSGPEEMQLSPVIEGNGKSSQILPTMGSDGMKGGGETEEDDEESAVVEKKEETTIPSSADKKRGAKREKVFACSLCSKQFAYKVSLGKHVKSVHHVDGNEERAFLPGKTVLSKEAMTKKRKRLDVAASAVELRKRKPSRKEKEHSEISDIDTDGDVKREISSSATRSFKDKYQTLKKEFLYNVCENELLEEDLESLKKKYRRLKIERRLLMEEIERQMKRLKKLKQESHQE